MTFRDVVMVVKSAASSDMVQGRHQNGVVRPDSIAEDQAFG